MSTEERDDEYLWSKRGAPDPEVERLERLLGRYAEPAATAPNSLAGERDLADRAREATSHRASHAWRPWLAAAAIVVVALGAWKLLASNGGGYEVRGVAGTRSLDVGESLDASADAELDLGALGEVRVVKGSRLRVVERGDELHKLYLERGAISASIFAAPRRFQIDTPAGLSVDLGCEYDLVVDDAGATTLSVRTGRVAFETDGRKVLVPHGASCHAVPGRGPDTPVFHDAELEFVAAVRAVEFASEPDEASIARVTELDRREDSLSLYHLLDAPSRELRGRIFDRLAQVYPQPNDVTREGIVAGDERMRASWLAELEADWR